MWKVSKGAVPALAFTLDWSRVASVVERSAVAGIEESKMK